MDSQKTPNKFESCDLGASSIAEIVRYSMNEKFRKKCYQVLKVDSTHALETVLNQKLRKICSVEDTAGLKKIAIKSIETGTCKEHIFPQWFLIFLSDDILLSESENSLTPPREPISWLFPSVEKRKSLKRSSSVADFLFEDSEKENSPVQFFSQQEKNQKVARMQLNAFSQAKSPYRYKSPSQRYLEDAMKGHRRRDRTQDVPEQTRKVLFFDDKPITNLF